MRSHSASIPSVIFVFFLLSNTPISSASEWRAVDLPARPMSIIENQGTLWVCGTDELIAASTDGGKTWTVKHSVKNGEILLTVGFANDQFGYAAGTSGAMIITKNGGNTWEQISAPAPVIYSVSFSDEKHGLIHTPRTVYTTGDGGATWIPVKIDLERDDLKGFSYVLDVLSLDANHMAIVLSEGNSHANDYRLLLSKDDGVSWKVVEIPSTGLAKLSASGGEYWFAGMEVIDKNKPGGGYGVPLAMHSPNGENWTHLPRWSKNEFSECNLQGCLYWDGAGVQLPPASPVSFWTFAPEKAASAEWAVAKDNICSVGTILRCAAVATTKTMPPYMESSSAIAPLISAPPLDAPPSQGLQCLYCDFERIMVTRDYQGLAEVQLKIYIAQNGLVEQAEIVRATNSGIGERIAASARNWIFVPFMKDGVVHPANTTVKLRVQAIKSK
jgi:photosystem II stability/assembly factor-like uncharacterized protein